MEFFRNFDTYKNKIFPSNFILHAMARRFRRFRRRGRRFRRRRIPRPLSQVYRFRRIGALGTLTASAAAAVTGAYEFQLDQVPGYTDFTSIFSQYMISKVVVIFRPKVTETNPASHVDWLNDCMTLIDYDDAAAAVLGVFQDSSTMRIWHPTRVHKRIIKPRWLSNTYSAAIDGYNPKRGWLSMANDDIPHYGLKYYIAQTNTATVMSWLVTVKYYIKFRMTV